MILENAVQPRIHTDQHGYPQSLLTAKSAENTEIQSLPDFAFPAFFGVNPVFQGSRSQCPSPLAYFAYFAVSTAHLAGGYLTAKYAKHAK